jgi:hypothetical protein
MALLRALHLIPPRLSMITHGLRAVAVAESFRALDADGHPFVPGDSRRQTPTVAADSAAMVATADEELR